MTIVLQGNTKSHPELTKIPVSINFAKTEEAKRLMQIVLQSHGPAVRPFVLPPRTPKDRVQILRKGFIDTMKDPEFLAETKKANLDINPTDGATLERRRQGDFEARTDAGRQAKRYSQIKTAYHQNRVSRRKLTQHVASDSPRNGRTAFLCRTRY